MLVPGRRECAPGSRRSRDRRQIARLRATAGWRAVLVDPAHGTTAGQVRDIRQVRVSSLKIAVLLCNGMKIGREIVAHGEPVHFDSQGA